MMSLQHHIIMRSSGSKVNYYDIQYNTWRAEDPSEYLHWFISPWQSLQAIMSPLIFFLLCVTFGQASGKKKLKDDSDKEQFKSCVSGFCLHQNYSNLELPDVEGSNHIDMDLEVLDILNVDDKKFSVSINIYFGIKWNETRLDTEVKDNAVNTIRILSSGSPD